MQNAKFRIAILAGFGCWAVAFGIAGSRDHAIAQHSDATANSAEMKRIFDQDQADRNINMASMTSQQRGEWASKIGPRDAQRRKQVNDLIARGALHTGDDFDEAAFVFQHGDSPDDYLLAHTLATVAIAKGSAKSRWIAAATLDRYLQKMKQPQIYGTQFFISGQPGSVWTQEPYNSELVPDSLRADMCVPSRASQQKTLRALRLGKGQEHEKIPGC